VGAIAELPPPPQDAMSNANSSTGQQRANFKFIIWISPGLDRQGFVQLSVVGSTRAIAL
jgi:hypothetical protein